VGVDFDDRLLAHLQIVIGSKLHRGELFYFAWKEDQPVGGGRTAVWMHSGASFLFKFSGSRPATINRAWLEALTYTANSPAGLHIASEPQDGVVSESALTG
jgi:hypothetical protein